MENVYLPSKRQPSERFTGSGIKITRPLTGETAKNKKFAYQNPIRKRTDLLYMSKGALLSISAPFTIPIRNAGFNLNADMTKLKFTPRSGDLPRITDWEAGDSMPEKGEGNQPDGNPEDQPVGQPIDQPGKDADLNQGTPFTGKLVSENPQLSDAEYLTAIAAEEAYRTFEDRGKNGRLVDAGYHFVPESSDQETSVFTDGNNVIVSLRGESGANDVLTGIGAVTVGVQNTTRFGADKNKIKEIAQHFKEEGKQGRIIVTGHSLGGSLAGETVRSILKEDPTLSQNLYGVTFNQRTGLTSACQGEECDNVINLRVKGDIGSVLDTNYTREIDGTCDKKYRSSMTQFTGQGCTSSGAVEDFTMGANRLAEGFFGGAIELSQRALKAGGVYAAEAAGGVLGSSVGGVAGGVAGAVAGKVIYDKAYEAVVGSEGLKNRSLESAARLKPSKKEAEQRKLNPLEEATDHLAGVAGIYAGVRLGGRAATMLKNRRSMREAGVPTTRRPPPALPPRPKRYKGKQPMYPAGPSGYADSQTQTDRTVGSSMGSQTDLPMRVPKGKSRPIRPRESADVRAVREAQERGDTGLPKLRGRNKGVETTPVNRTSSGSQTQELQTVNPQLQTTATQTTGRQASLSKSKKDGPRRRASYPNTMMDRLGPSRELVFNDVEGSAPSFVTPRRVGVVSSAPPVATNSLRPTAVARRDAGLATALQPNMPNVVTSGSVRRRETADQRTIREGQNFVGSTALGRRGGRNTTRTSSLYNEWNLFQRPRPIRRRSSNILFPIEESRYERENRVFGRPNWRPNS